MSYAAAHAFQFEDSDAVRCEAAWERWLLNYWKFRKLGTPQPLSPEEADGVACWSLSVGKHFPQAVEMITSTTIAGAFLLFDILRFSIYRLNKKQLANNYPQEVADLFLFCLKTARDGVSQGLISSPYGMFSGLQKFQSRF